MYEDLKDEILKLLSKNVRLDGRGLSDYREVVVEKGVSKNAEGSARVKIGDTEVIAGVKMEVIKPYPDSPEDGSMMINVELTSLSSPDFEIGPPSIYAVELARITDRGIRESKSIDTKKLCITKGEKAWMIIVDICTLNDAGNMFDAIALAALAAIQDAVFPTYDEETGSIDYKKKTTTKIPMSKVPVTVTVFKYGNHLLVDPTDDEGKVYDARLTVSVLDNGNICSLQKGGDVAMTVESTLDMIELARQKSQELRSKL